MLNLTQADKNEIEVAIATNQDISDQLYEKLFDYFCNSGEMPTCIAKGRTGDPLNWIYFHMHEVL